MEPPRQPASEPSALHSRGRALSVLGLAIAIAIWGGGRDLWNEGALSMHGDMARYLMNGVFLRDLAASGTFLSWSELIRFAESYYAQYPALSLGHHPPLLPLLLAPAFELFGVSAVVGRLVSVAAFLLAAVVLYRLAWRLYGWRVAGWTVLLFASHPVVVSYSQQVMAEMLMLALIILAFWQLLVFLETERPRHFAAFVVVVALSLAARQLAVIAVPGYLAVALIYRRPRRVLRRHLLIAAAAGALALVPLAILTIELSPFNVRYVLDLRNRSMAGTMRALRVIFDGHLQSWLWLAIAGGLLAAIRARDRRILLPVGWGVGGLLLLLALTGQQSAERYSLAIVPAFCLAAGALEAGSARWAIRAGRVLLTVVLVAQAIASSQVRPVGAPAYEAAAKWIVAQSATPTVMFSGPVDTGYFVFYVRKHDPARRIVVLRSDKIFTTSMMDKLAREERIGSVAEIYPILQRFGTRFVVAEDLPIRPGPIAWFHDELKSSQFIERLRIPQQSDDPRLQGSDLVIYEYVEATTPDPEAMVDLHLPLVGRRLAVPLADLLPVGQ